MKRGKNTGPVVLLLGAHRSGTSLAARLLGTLGLPLGDDLIPGHADNPEGFWEHRRVLEHSREVEGQLDVNPLRGGRLLPPDGKWWRGKPVDRHVRELGTFLSSEVERFGAFGFKDPRTLVLMPMWRAATERARVKPAHLVLLRHPGAVAASYAKRQNLEPQFSEYIWLLHWSYAIHHMPQQPAGILHFERWFSERDEQVERARGMLADLGIEDVGDGADARALMRSDLDHHKSKRGTDDLMPDTAELYQALSTATESGGWERAREIARRVLDRHQLIGPAYRFAAARARKSERQVRDRDEKINGLRERMRSVQEQVTDEAAGLPIEQIEPRPPAPYEAEFPSLDTFIGERRGPGRKLKVCIATEDIVGPIRNGGIGTTYFYLAKMLAEAGHDTSIVYVRGDHCENESIEHWVDYYAGFNVRFLALNPNEKPVNCPAPRWMRPMLALHEHLKSEHYDLVHVSEWRGTGYVAQAAKSQGLAFADTLFCVKTSSPWLWNREYGFHTLGDTRDLPKVHAERRSVELGDLVVGGSRHLLCWMLEHGYRLPPARTYVQPNVMIPVDLDDEAAVRRQSYGQRMTVAEIVFFGRLEYRKGLDVFFDAIEILLDSGMKLPRIHLLGKVGEAIPSYSELTTDEYIEYRTANWPMKVELHKDRDTEGALRFLLDGRRLAVMPSIIENSSLAVYETAYYGIPFIASDRGGTPELVKAKHREQVLTEPHPVPLARKISEALREGGFIAEPSFSNRRNLGTWLRFHAAIGAYLQERDDSRQPAGVGDPVPSVSVCLAVDNNHEYVQEVIETVERAGRPGVVEIVLADNGSRRDATKAWLNEMGGRKDVSVRLERLEAWGEQHAENQAAKVASGELLVFLRSGAFPDERYFEVLGRAAAARAGDVFCCFYEELTGRQRSAGESGTPQAFFADDISYGFFDAENVSPVLAVRREAFERLGGFREDFKVPGAQAEFVAQANLAGARVTTIPEYIAVDVTDYPLSRRLNFKALTYRTIRPYLERAPHCYSRILLRARGGSGLGVARTASHAARQNSGTPEGVDARARELAGELAGFSGVRSFGWRVYNAQHRLFLRLVALEIRGLRRVVRVLRRLRRR